MTTRRSFLTSSSAAVAGASFGLGGRRHAAATVPRPRRCTIVDPVIRVEADPTVRTLALRAIDAAKAAGATYADVRLTRILTQSAAPMGGNGEAYGIGVRALVNGYWGFTASPYWRPEEAVQLARDAVAQAKNNALGTTRPAELGTIPVASGSWKMPVKIDPFTVPIEEKEEYLAAVAERARQYYHGVWNYPRTSDGQWDPITFVRQERAIATTDGAYFTQTTYTISANFNFVVQDFKQRGKAELHAKGLGFRAMGWEMILDADVPNQFPALVAEGMAQLGVPDKAGDVGQYDVVFDAHTMAGIVANTLGDATQLDRALGYEANASGTSYLDDPLAMLGSYRVGSPLLTLTANRSMPGGGLATVRWDDEGVEPEEFTLIKEGVLVDYQTTREQASWLGEYYQKAGKPVRSHGCAASDSALSITMQHTPNLVMAPAKEDISFDDLVRDTKKGIAVMGGTVGVDFQGLTASSAGVAGGAYSLREIVNGRLGAKLSGMGFMFNTLDFWKNLTAVGGTRSTEGIAASNYKGQPAQGTYYSVTAVPAKVRNVSFIDPRRKA